MPLLDVFKLKASRLPFNMPIVAELLIYSYHAHNLLDHDGLCRKLGLTSHTLPFNEGVNLRPDVLGQIDVCVLDADHLNLL